VGIITEEGIVRAPFEEGLREAVEKAREKLQSKQSSVNSHQ
jgi:hypothetical protein